MEPQITPATLMAHRCEPRGTALAPHTHTELLNADSCIPSWDRQPVVAEHTVRGIMQPHTPQSCTWLPRLVRHGLAGVTLPSQPWVPRASPAPRHGLHRQRAAFKLRGLRAQCEMPEADPGAPRIRLGGSECGRVWLPALAREAGAQPSPNAA